MEGFPATFGLDGRLVLGLFLLLGFLYIMHRYRPKPVLQPLSVDIAWDAVSEPAGTANAALSNTLDGMAGSNESGRSLVRLVLYNRGTRDLLPAHYREAVLVAFPDAGHIEAARFSEAVKCAPPEDTSVTIDGRTVALPQAAIPAGGLLVFNIVVCGRADTLKVTADFDGQNGLYRLG